MIGKAYNSFGDNEMNEVLHFSFRARRGAPLSGYLAGRHRGGDQVVLLEDAWSKVFSVKHSIAVNSATSGLLAAAFASGLKAGDKFSCPTMTMSATAAAPCFTNARPDFRDVSDIDFGIDWPTPVASRPKAVFVTNLFGHPARLHEIRRSADLSGVMMIEDNAQSPFAMERGKYAGTIGHIGVFSLNIHKPIQCGEGGMIVTDDDALAEAMRAFINHGEHHSAANIGLNLRMPEVCAVIALTQLQRSPVIIAKRQEQALAIMDAIGFIPGLRPPVIRKDCTHVFYTIPFLIDRSRARFCEVLIEEGVPVVEHYAEPVHQMTAFEAWRPSAQLPVASALYTKRLFYIDNCAWTFNKKEIKQIGDAFKKAAEAVKL